MIGPHTGITKADPFLYEGGHLAISQGYPRRTSRPYHIAYSTTASGVLRAHPLIATAGGSAMAIRNENRCLPERDHDGSHRGQLRPSRRDITTVYARSFRFIRHETQLTVDATIMGKRARCKGRWEGKKSNSILMILIFLVVFIGQKVRTQGPLILEMRHPFDQPRSGPTTGQL
jgi:hypothetical protein